MFYTLKERFWLVVLAVVGLVGVNGLFLWTTLTRTDALLAAIKNPIAAAFMLEAILMVVVLAYLLGKWKVSTVHWLWFVLLALLGGLLFALPFVLLWSERKRRELESSTTPPR